MGSAGLAHAAAAFDFEDEAPVRVVDFDEAPAFGVEQHVKARIAPLASVEEGAAARRNHVDQRPPFRPFREIRLPLRQHRAHEITPLRRAQPRLLRLLLALPGLWPVPSTQAPGQAVVTAATSPAAGAARLEFGAAHATSFLVLHKGPGDEGFKQVADVLLPGVYDATGLAEGQHEFKIVPENSRGRGPEGALATIAAAVAAAA